jgi:hypothetical protein
MVSIRAILRRWRQARQRRHGGSILPMDDAPLAQRLRRAGVGYSCTVTEPPPGASRIDWEAMKARIRGPSRP